MLPGAITRKTADPRMAAGRFTAKKVTTDKELPRQSSGAALLGKVQAVFLSLRSNSTRSSMCRRVKFLAQLLQSQKFSIALSFVGNPKNLPPSMRMSILEHCGLAHFEIMSRWQLLDTLT